MSNQSTPIDFSRAAPEIQRLAEEVHASRQPRSIERDGETIAVVMPVASKRARRWGKPSTVKEVSTMERAQARERLFAPVSPEEIARRQALVQQILAAREKRVITPLTTDELVHRVREEEYRSYDDRR